MKNLWIGDRWRIYQKVFKIEEDILEVNFGAGKIFLILERL